MREDGGRFTGGAISMAVIATFMIVFIRSPLPDGRVCFTVTICNEDAGVRLILAQGLSVGGGHAKALAWISPLASLPRRRPNNAPSATNAMA